jgi:eukaryotic-like serine/threonine-protein kinase
LLGFGSVLESGLFVTPNIRLVRQLGQGGMGSVWVADHLTLHTQVAVKFISTELASSQEALGRFSREASAAAQINSPHVVRTFDHGVLADSTPYIVMELLQGEDLGTRIERDQQLDLNLVSGILAQACKALGKAHELGIVHRDIKPDNLFLTQDDEGVFVRVLDFGVAKQSTSTAMNATSTGAVMGTPYYMSPEQMLSSKHVDLRSDLWALGVVVYHAVTGLRPFDGETLGGLCVAINEAHFETPSKYRPGLPPEVDRWFARALARDPAARFDSARHMAEAFARAISGVSISMPPPRPGGTVAAATSPMVRSDSVGGASNTLAGPLPGKRSLALPLILGGLGLVLVVGVVGVGLVLKSRGSEAVAPPSAAAAAPVVPSAPPSVAPAAPAPVVTVAPAPAASVAAAPAAHVAAKPAAVSKPAVAAPRPAPAPAAPKPKLKDRGF